MNTNEPAFPRDHRHDGHNGMDLRDYFAAKAMQGLLAGVHPICKDDDPVTPVATAAYLMADAMLRARVKP